jgi:transketolase
MSQRPLPDDLDQLCINTIRMLSIDAVQKADSGHPGMPMGAARLHRRTSGGDTMNREWTT